MSAFHGKVGGIYTGQTTSIKMDALGDTITIPDNAALDFDSTTSFSIELWGKFGAISTSNYLIKGDPSAEAGWSLADSNASKINFTTYDKGTPSVLLAGVIGTTKVAHAVFVRNVSTAKLYAYSDGAFSTSSATFTVSSDLTNASNLVFGGGAASWYLQQARIYNTALTAAQVSDLYLGQKVAGDNLVADWRATVGRGTVMWDSTGNDHNGTIANATWDTTNASYSIAARVCTSNSATSWTISNMTATKNVKVTSVTTNAGAAINGWSATTTGVINLQTAQTSKPIKANFNYYPVVNMAVAFHNWSLDYTAETHDVTTFCVSSPYPRTFVPGVTSWSGSAERYLKTPEYIGVAGTEVIVKLFWDKTTNARYEGWAIVTGVSTTTPVDDIVTETVNFQGTGAIATATN